MRERALPLMLAILFGHSLLNVPRTSADASPALPAHLTAAEAIATGISAADNEYAHKECFIRWKGVDGADKYSNRTDCSDFFNLLTEHVYGFKPAQFKIWTGDNRPTAAAWYDAATSGRAGDFLQTLKTLSEARPGDMIFIKYQPGGSDTGHVMLIAETPIQREPTTPVISGTQQWEVTVIDSSKSGHGPRDTRHNPDGTFSRGVGKGTLRLYTQDDGKLAGYCWSTLKASKFDPISEHAIAIVHLRIPSADH